jgi:hypothetical protein
MKRALVQLLMVSMLVVPSQSRCADAGKPSAAAPSKPAAGLAFVAGGGGEFLFDTGVLRGKLRPEGRSRGLASVVHVPTGATVDRGYGLLGFYRVFTTGTRYGPGAWDWPSTAELLADGGVLVRWPPAGNRGFELAATYRWRAPDVIEVEAQVKARQELRQFEVFLASYFDPAFTNSLAYVKANPAGGGKPGFLAASASYGQWLMYPRDQGAVALITDGRWKLEPNPVNWTLLPALAAPLGLRRASQSGLAAVLMAPATDCFAIATPHETEGHYSMYLSLFGRDIKAAETAKARARLWIAAKPTDQQILEAYAASSQPLRK